MHPHLFRLSSELRDNIWAFAYGDLKVHVYDDGMLTRDRLDIRQLKLHCYMCMQEWTPGQHLDHLEQIDADDRTSSTKNLVPP